MRSTKWSLLLACVIGGFVGGMIPNLVLAPLARAQETGTLEHVTASRFIVADADGNKRIELGFVASDNQAFNGLPQFVMYDRLGKVRLRQFISDARTLQLPDKSIDLPADGTRLLMYNSAGKPTLMLDGLEGGPGIQLRSGHTNTFLLMHPCPVRSNTPSILILDDDKTIFSAP